MAKTARMKANRLGEELAWKEWNGKFKQAVLDLGSAVKEHPGLFPNGITKIELSISLATLGELAVRVEGPESKPSGAKGE